MWLITVDFQWLTFLFVLALVVVALHMRSRAKAWAIFCAKSLAQTSYLHYSVFELLFHPKSHYYGHSRIKIIGNPTLRDHLRLFEAQTYYISSLHF